MLSQKQRGGRCSFSQSRINSAFAVPAVKDCWSQCKPLISFLFTLCMEDRPFLSSSQQLFADYYHVLLQPFPPSWTLPILPCRLCFLDLSSLLTSGFSLVGPHLTCTVALTAGHSTPTETLSWAEHSCCYLAWKPLGPVMAMLSSAAGRLVNNRINTEGTEVPTGQHIKKKLQLCQKVD